MPKRAQSAVPHEPPSEPDPRPGPDEDYAALEGTLRGSELGRRFLAGYARKIVSSETQLLLNAIARLEAAVIEPERRGPSARALADLVMLSGAFVETQWEIGDEGALCGNDANPARRADVFGQIVDASAQATSDVLAALEDVQNVSWALRDQGVASELCDRLDERTVDIFAACARQEIAGQKTAQTIDLLRDIERRINTMIEQWGKAVDTNLMDAARSLDISGALEPVLSTDEDAERSRSESPRDPAAPQDRLSGATCTPTAEGFKAPEPLTLKGLDTVQRAALFG